MLLYDWLSQCFHMNYRISCTELFLRVLTLFLFSHYSYSFLPLPISAFSSFVSSLLTLVVVFYILRAPILLEYIHRCYLVEPISVFVHYSSSYFLASLSLVGVFRHSYYILKVFYPISFVYQIYSRLSLFAVFQIVSYILANSLLFSLSLQHLPQMIPFLALPEFLLYFLYYEHLDRQGMIR